MLPSAAASPSDEVRASARALLNSRLQHTATFAFPPEVATWLDLLPQCQAGSGGSWQAVASFLVDACVAMARRPHELYDMAAGLLAEVGLVRAGAGSLHVHSILTSHHHATSCSALPGYMQQPCRTCALLSCTMQAQPDLHACC